MAKGDRHTSGNFKLSDIEPGKDYSDNKFEKIMYDLTGRKNLEDHYGYSVRSVKVNGVTYDNVITKKIKTKDGRTRYEIMK